MPFSTESLFSPNTKRLCLPNDQEGLSKLCCSCTSYFGPTSNTCIGTAPIIETLSLGGFGFGLMAEVNAQRSSRGFHQNYYRNNLHDPGVGQRFNPGAHSNQVTRWIGKSQIFPTYRWPPQMTHVLVLVKPRCRLQAGDSCMTRRPTNAVASLFKPVPVLLLPRIL